MHERKGKSNRQGCPAIQSGVVRLGPNKLKKEYIDLVRERTDGRKHLYYLGPDGLVLKECKYIGG